MFQCACRPFKVPLLLRKLEYCFSKPPALICITSVFITISFLENVSQILHVEEKENEMLFTSLGLSVLGKTVPFVLCTQGLGYSFSQYGPPAW